MASGCGMGLLLLCSGAWQFLPRSVVWQVTGSRKEMDMRLDWKGMMKQRQKPKLKIDLY